MVRRRFQGQGEHCVIGSPGSECSTHTPSLLAIMKTNMFIHSSPELSKVSGFGEPLWIIKYMHIFVLCLNMCVFVCRCVCLPV